MELHGPYVSNTIIARQYTTTIKTVKIDPFVHTHRIMDGAVNVKVIHLKQGFSCQYYFALA